MRPGHWRVADDSVHRDKLLEQQEAGDTFIQKLMAGVFRHLEVTVTDVHIRCLNPTINCNSSYQV